MKTKYLVWKDPTCNGINPDWQIINKKEFFTLVRCPENKGRLFIKIPSVSEDGRDCMLVMEGTRADYLKWRKEYDHNRHAWSFNKHMHVNSFDALMEETPNNECPFLIDTTVNIEEDYIKKIEPEILYHAISKLSQKEQALLDMLFLSENIATEKEYAKIKNVTQQAIHAQKTKILKKLKEILED